MLEEDCKSGLRLDYLYFSEINCSRQQLIKKAKLNVNYDVDRKINGNEAIVKIVTNIKSHNDEISLSLTTIGKFTLIDLENVYDDSIKKEMLNLNTVAIIMPYIRSQVSIITTQPDLTPIMLQPVDVTLLMAQKAENM